MDMCQFTAHLLDQVHHENMFRREAECECFRCDSHAVWMSVVCVCVCVQPYLLDLVSPEALQMVV